MAAKAREPGFAQLSLPLRPRDETSPVLPVQATPPSKPQINPEPEPKNEQTPFFPERFEREFLRRVRRAWAIHWTENRSRVLALWSRRHPPEIRVQRFFSQAPLDVISGIADVAENRAKPWPKAVNRFIVEQCEALRDSASRPPRRPLLETEGQVHDLSPAFDRLNRTYFDGLVGCPFGWMPVRKRRVHGVVKLGSYSEAQDCIRLHPILDQSGVPLYVIEAILYHEMVHAVLKSTHRNGRRVVHGREFKALMRHCPYEAEADAWIKEHLESLLRRFRRSRPAR